MVEVLVYGATLTLLVGITWTVLIVCMRNYQIHLGTSEIEQACAAASSRLAWELVETAPTGISATSDGVVFVSPRADDGNVKTSGGEVVWPRLVCYYLDEVAGVKTLFRKEETLTTAQVGTPIVPAGRTPAWFKTANLPRLTVARHVDALELTLGYPMTLSVSATTAPLGQDCTIAFTTVLTPRN